MCHTAFCSFYTYFQLFHTKYLQLYERISGPIDIVGSVFRDINSRGNVILMSVIILCHQYVTWQHKPDKCQHITPWTGDISPIFTHIPSSPRPACTFITHFTIQFQFNKKWCSCTLNYSGYWFCINQSNIEHCTQTRAILSLLSNVKWQN